MYYFYVLAKRLTLIFPRVFCYRIAKCIAVLKFYFSRKEREALMYNLSAIIPDAKEAKRVAREVFINFAYYLVDFFRYEKLDKRFIEKYVTVSGLEYLPQPLDGNKGVLTVTAHLGNYELAGAITSLLGYTVHAVALPHKDQRINELFNRQRKMVGIHIIPAGVTVRKCVSLLREPTVVAFLGDRDFFGGGLEITMMGHRVRLPKGPAFFALKTGACIVPAFLVREKRIFYRLIFEAPIDIQGQKLTSEEMVLEAYAKVLEKYLKKYPQQWYLFTKYWLE
ncbi:MAG: lysophospholipid acyltransferase family protein [Candidatus Omnitrophota bacterium]